MVKFKFFVEDSYGVEFFKRLVSVLRDNGLICNHIDVDVQRRVADCNKRFGKMLKAALEFDFSRVILILDGDGNPEDKRKIAKSHVSNELQDKVDIIVFEYEIEEWICKSLGINYRCYGYIKPSKALNDWLRTKKGREYKKRHLPQFVRKIDITFLKQNDERFRKLIECLKC